jgi:hypothetical protein
MEQYTSLNHPNICRVHEVHANETEHVMIMEELSGGSLVERFVSRSNDIEKRLQVPKWSHLHLIVGLRKRIEFFPLREYRKYYITNANVYSIFSHLLAKYWPLWASYMTSTLSIVTYNLAISCIPNKILKVKSKSVTTTPPLSPRRYWTNQVRSVAK